MKRNPYVILCGYTGEMTEYFVGLLGGFQGSREISPVEKTSLCDVLHLPYGPLLSWLHQHRQTNNTYKCERCRFYNSIPVGVIVTSFKAELVRFRKETERSCTCDSRRLDAMIQQALHFKVKKTKPNTLKSWKKRAKPQKEQQQNKGSYTLASTRAPVWLPWLGCWSCRREQHEPAGNAT